MGGKGAEVSLEGLDDINIELSLIGGNPINTVSNSTTALNSNGSMTATMTSTMNSHSDLTANSSLTSTSSMNAHSDLNSKAEMLMRSTSEVDVRPLIMDSCMTLRLAPLPETCVHQPYSHRVAFSLLGKEVFGVSFAGSKRTEIRTPPKSVVMLEDSTVMKPRAHHARPEATYSEPHERGAPRSASDGLRIKIQ